SLPPGVLAPGCAARRVDHPDLRPHSERLRDLVTGGPGYLRALHGPRFQPVAPRRQRGGGTARRQHLPRRSQRVSAPPAVVRPLVVTGSASLVCARPTAAESVRLPAYRAISRETARSSATIRSRTSRFSRASMVARRRSATTSAAKLRKALPSCSPVIRLI